VSALVFVLVRPHLVDEAFITLSSARSLAFHGHWRLIEDARALVLGSAGAYAADGLPREFAPFTTNHASTARYRQIGDEVHPPGRCAHREQWWRGGRARLLPRPHDDRHGARCRPRPPLGTGRTGGLGRLLVEAKVHFFDLRVRPRKLDHILFAMAAGATVDRCLLHRTIGSPWSGTQRLCLAHAWAVPGHGEGHLRAGRTARGGLRRWGPRLRSGACGRSAAARAAAPT
jgi:hypothetical protein